VYLDRVKTEKAGVMLTRRRQSDKLTITPTNILWDASQYPVELTNITSLPGTL